MAYISNNISIYTPPGLFNIRNKVLNSDVRSSMKGHYSTALSSPPTDYYLNFCTKRDTKLVNDTQQSIAVVVEPLLVAPCTACRISLLPTPLRIERKSTDPSGLSAN